MEIGTRSFAMLIANLWQAQSDNLCFKLEEWFLFTKYCCFLWTGTIWDQLISQEKTSFRLKLIFPSFLQILGNTRFAPYWQTYSSSRSTCELRTLLTMFVCCSVRASSSALATRLASSARYQRTYNLLAICNLLYLKTYNFGKMPSNLQLLVLSGMIQYNNRTKILMEFKVC